MASFKIASVLEKRFPIITKDAFFARNGFVFGIQPSGKKGCFVCCGLTTSLDDVPIGNNVFGVFQLDGNNDSLNMIAKDFTDKVPEDDRISPVIVLHSQNDGSLKAYIYNSGSLEDHQLESVNFAEEYSSKFVQINVKIATKIVTVDGKLGPNDSPTKSEDFKLNDSKFKLTANQKKAKTVGDLYSQLELSDLDGLDAIPANMKKKFIEKEQNKHKTQRTPLTFTVQNSTGSNKDVKIVDGGVFHIYISFMLQISDSISALIDALSAAEQKYVKAFWNATDDGKVVPETLNFYNAELYAHTITVSYSFGDAEQELKQREATHHKYFIPKDKPYFGKFQALNGNVPTQGCLYNVHEGLKLAMNDGIVSIVSGKYLYYHYAQQNMQDSGWGCAYRSLQAIVSWFQLQGYISDNVPTHQQIQEALVQCGDKPASFIGSNKWIGSQEVSYVLSQLFKIQSKIMFVSSGTELGSKARELIQHFEEVGTPIMIGGGVLAHTILGVHFNQANGDIRFLVLDPHYVGVDEITNIHKKAGISWKPLSFWSPTDFYNLCLPQRPNTF